MKSLSISSIVIASVLLPNNTIAQVNEKIVISGKKKLSTENEYTILGSQLQYNGIYNIEDLINNIGDKFGIDQNNISQSIIIYINGIEKADLNSVYDLPVRSIVSIQIFSGDLSVAIGQQYNSKIISITTTETFREVNFEGKISDELSSRDMGKTLSGNYSRYKKKYNLDVSSSFEKFQAETKYDSSNFQNNEFSENGIKSLKINLVNNNILGVRASSSINYFAVINSNNTVSENINNTNNIDTEKKISANFQVIGSLLSYWDFNSKIAITRKNNSFLNLNRNNRLEQVMSSQNDKSIKVILSGPVLRLPYKGYAFGAINYSINARSSNVLNQASKQTNVENLRFNISVPIISGNSRISNKLGAITSNYSVEEMRQNGFSAKNSNSLGLTWQTRFGAKISTLYSNANNPVLELSELAIDKIVNKKIYDYSSGSFFDTRLILRTNQNLPPENKKSFSFELTYRPKLFLKDANFLLKYENTDRHNAIIYPHSFDKYFETYYPNRVNRDNKNNLISLDLSPISVSKIKSTYVKFGLNISKSFGELVSPKLLPEIEPLKDKLGIGKGIPSGNWSFSAYKTTFFNSRTDFGNNSGVDFGYGNGNDFKSIYDFSLRYYYKGYSFLSGYKIAKKADTGKSYSKFQIEGTINLDEIENTKGRQLFGEHTFITASYSSDNINSLNLLNGSSFYEDRKKNNLFTLEAKKIF